jgi:hypothetical protein
VARSISFSHLLPPDSRASLELLYASDERRLA